MLRNYVLVLCLAVLTGTAFTQTTKVRPSKGGSDVPVKNVRVKEKDRVFVHDESEDSKASFDALNLMDLQGNKLKPKLDGVTIIEYWNSENNSENLYWNKVRELEHQFAGSDEVRIISINYDDVRSGKYHREAVAKYLKTTSSPQTLYLDMDDGFRDSFYVYGPVSYMLIDHRQQYTNAGRGDDPETIKLFEDHLVNAIKHYQLIKAKAEKERLEKAQRN